MEPTKPFRPHQPPAQPYRAANPSANHTQPVNGTSTPQIQHTAQPNHSLQINKGGSRFNGNGWAQQIKGFFSFAMFIGGVLVAAFLINQFVFQSYFVEGTSMVPTLNNNDRLIIEKVDKTLSQIQGKPYIPSRGDIVVLDSSIIASNGSSEQLIKRVIGLPGDIVRVEDGKVTVFTDEEPQGFDVDKRLGIEVEPTYSSSAQEYNVPEGKVFVMGDNRAQNGSHDSRAFGPVASKDLVGKLWARILPVDQAQLYPTPSPN